MKINLSQQATSIEKLYSISHEVKNSIKEISHSIENKDYIKGESFAYLPFDEKQIIKLLEFKKKIPSKELKKIAVIGIGGSIQGTKAVYEFLRNHKKLISMEFIDQIDSEKISNLSKELKELDYKLAITQEEQRLVI
jgi:glucose-6-phosphate isomerase